MEGAYREHFLSNFLREEKQLIFAMTSLASLLCFWLVLRDIFPLAFGAQDRRGEMWSNCLIGVIQLACLGLMIYGIRLSREAKMGRNVGLFGRWLHRASTCKTCYTELCLEAISSELYLVGTVLLTLGSKWTEPSWYEGTLHHLIIWVARSVGKYIRGEISKSVVVMDVPVSQPLVLLLEFVFCLICGSALYEIDKQRRKAWIHEGKNRRANHRGRNLDHPLGVGSQAGLQE